MSAPYYSDDSVTLWHGDALDILRRMESGSVNCIVTSPPYFGLRDYGVDGQIGAEESPAEFVAALVAVFREARRVLADDGTLWLNLGDTYASDSKWGGRTGGKHAKALHGDTGVGRGKRTTGLPDKNLIGIPWRVAFALQDDGWILRNDIIWAKPNGMPNSVTDRLATKHEHIFMFAKQPRYWFNLDPIRDPHSEASIARYAKPIRFTHPSADNNGQRGQIDGGHIPERGVNPGDVWTIATQPFAEAHFAVMPPTLAERCVQAGCKPGGTVLDPFSGSGTTGMAAAKHGRRYVGIDLNREYLDLSLRTRLAQGVLDFEGTA